MHNVSNTAGFIGDCKTPGKNGDFATTPEMSEKSSVSEGYENLIDKANTVPLIKIFKMYGILLDEFNRKICCPFKSHKGGRENTASFYYYHATNTYWCFGCKQGKSPVDFVSNMDGCFNRNKSASKILENFLSDADEDLILTKEDFSERIEIMMAHSNAIREFRLNNISDESIIFIEKHCGIYDDINEKHNLNNEALKSVVDKLIENLKTY